MIEILRKKLIIGPNGPERQFMSDLKRNLDKSIEKQVREGMNDGFYLKAALPLDSRYDLEPSLIEIRDALKSKDLNVLVVACLLNSFVDQKRIVACIGTKHFLGMIVRNPNLTRRKREKLKLSKLISNYNKLMAVVHKCKFFKFSYKPNSEGNVVTTLELEASPLRSMMETLLQLSAQNQHTEIEKYFATRRQEILRKESAGALAPLTKRVSEAFVAMAKVRLDPEKLPAAEFDLARAKEDLAKKKAKIEADDAEEFEFQRTRAVEMLAAGRRK